MIEIKVKAFYNRSGKVERRKICTENKEVYCRIAKMIIRLPKPDKGENIMVSVSINGKNVLQYVMKVINGYISVSEVANHAPEEWLDMDLKAKYLTCVHPETNSAGNNANRYKFCELQPLYGKDADAMWARLPSERKSFLQTKTKDGGPLMALNYGRIAVDDNSPWRKRTYVYPLSCFWMKYFEKADSGFDDNSDTIYGDSYQPNIVVRNAGDITLSGKPEIDLFRELQKHAADTVKAAAVTVPITAQIISESERLVGMLRNEKHIGRFNETVLKLLAILQRPIAAGVMLNNMLANSEEDFARIIERETELIEAMKVSVDGIMMSVESFKDYGIEVYPATPKQERQVFSHLSKDLKGKVDAVYRVIPCGQKKIFNDYLHETGITNVKLLWHGSRNANWLSIVKNSLSLNPNAVITGKMFGYGIYFASSSMKSFGYTSMHGSYWAKGKSDTAYMGLYACALGKSFNVNCYQHDLDYKNETLNHGCDSLFAHKGDMLKNDEIVFYDPRAVLLDYIVKFKN